jgi:hypothetical protein
MMVTLALKSNEAKEVKATEFQVYGSVQRASQKIRSNWTAQQRKERAAMAEKQTMRLVELLFGSGTPFASHQGTDRGTYPSIDQ